MKLSARFDYQQVDHEKDNTVRLLLTVDAPTIDWVAQRPKICVVPVLDTSGSMGGPKFDYAKQAIKKLVEQLKIGDYSGLITFSYQASVVVKPAPVTPEFKTRLLKVLDEIRPGGGTNFSDAVSKSLSALGDLDLPPSILHRVIFFTDGQPTSGIVDTAVIKGLVAQNVGSYSMSFFGYGDVQGNQCDQTFLTELSDLGKGNYAYVQNPDDALAAFGRELGGLLSTYASDLRLVIEPRNGHTIEKVVTILPEKTETTQDLTELSLELGDILAEESRHVVLECSIKRQEKALPRDFTIFSVKATCRRVTQEGSKAVEEALAAAKIRFVRPDEAQKTPTVDVDQVVALHQLAWAQKEAEANADKGLYVEAQGVLDHFSRDVQTRGHINVASVAQGLRRRMGSNSLYSSTEGYRKTIGKGLVRGATVSSYEVSAQADLNSVGGRTVGNSAQTAYTTAFTGAEASAPTPLTFSRPLDPIDLDALAARVVIQPVVKSVTPTVETTSAGRPLMWASIQPDVDLESKEGTPKGD